MNKTFRQEQIQELVEGAEKFTKVAALFILMGGLGLADIAYTGHNYPKDQSYQTNLEKRKSAEKTMDYRYEDRYGRLRGSLAKTSLSLGLGAGLGLLCIAGVKYCVANDIAKRED
jgi:hypothetical protein